MSIQRRQFLKLMSASLMTPFMMTTQQSPSAMGIPKNSPSGSPTGNVFDLSVASGDPTPTGVVLWTRINPNTYLPTVALQFQLATDTMFTQIVVAGQVKPQDINAERDYTVNLDLDGLLESRQTYYYRFRYGDILSPTGRCKTLPPLGSALDSAQFAVITCNDYSSGYFNAFNQLAQESDLDFVIHLGDFIYEYATYNGIYDPVRRVDLPSGENVAMGLEDFRAIYQTYRRDSSLQHALEQHTWIVVWDDHETGDDTYWDYERDTLGAPNHPYTTQAYRFQNPQQSLRQLRFDAQQAWIEYVPARVKVNPAAEHPLEYLQMYRRFQVGDLLDLYMTDSRTYRSQQPCQEADVTEACAENRSPDNTMLGTEQREWLVQGMSHSSARWKVWGNQTLMGRLVVRPQQEAKIYVSHEAWDGYEYEREQIMQALKQAPVDNLLVLTGDFHSTMACYLKIDYEDFNNWHNANIVGLEIMTPSISSPNLKRVILAESSLDININALTETVVRLINPHIKMFNSDLYGYSIVRLDQKHCEWTIYNIDTRTDNPNATKKQFKKLRYDPKTFWLWELDDDNNARLIES